MVRLKEAIWGANNTFTAFQFHYGTIKSVSAILPTQYGDDFNSTMVRLKGLRNVSGRAATLFQFHYGTIKSQLKTGQRGQFVISIPLWYD